MELVTGSRKRSRLEEINAAAVAACESVEAAVAYVTDDPPLIKECLRLQRKLSLWARYDFSVPVAPSVLRQFLERNSPNFVCRMVPDIFHPKIIWWHGFGAYIGSANLTYSAWNQNFEAGLFLSDEELVEEELAEPLRQFFLDVDSASHPLTREIVEQMERLTKDAFQKQELEARGRFDKIRLIPKLASLISVDQKPAQQRYREEFLKEWNETLEILRGLGSMMATYRPAWIATDVPAGAQADRFLHAYYVTKVTQGNRVPYEDFHRQNAHDPAAAIEKELSWWRDLSSAPAQVDVMIREHLPVVREGLAKERLLQLTEDEFAKLCENVHALHDHAQRVSWRSFELAEPLPGMTHWERALYLGRYLYKQRSKRGWSAAETINYVIHSEPLSEIPNRIFQVCNDPNLKIRHLGLGSLGEMAGWAHPDEFPPRNGRTSKSLRALGYNVRVHSESSS